MFFRIRFFRTFATLILALLCALNARAERVLQDETGRTVRLADHVSRVISLTPSLTDTVYALGASSQLVAITDFTSHPPQAAREKPSVGDILNPSIERIVSYHPDVVVAVSTLNSPETVKGLERVHVPVFLIDGRGLTGVYNSIVSMGKVLGREREAATLTAQLKNRQARIEQDAKNKPHPSVFLAVQLEPCITAGKGAFITELIGIAGAHSVTDDLKQDWLRVNLEAILPRKPQYILLLKSAAFTLKDMRALPGWRALEAVKAGRIIYADDRLQIPGPAAFDGLEDLARQISAAAK